MKINIRNIISYLLYPKVYEEYLSHLNTYHDISKLESDVFFYGLNKGEECEVEIDPGKVLTIKFIDMTEANEYGKRTLMFELNGMLREIEIEDKTFSSSIKNIQKADINNELQIGASIPGKVVNVLAKSGEEVKKNQPLIIIEAMKMETVIVAKTDGVVDEIYVKNEDIVSDNQLLITMK